MHMWWWARCEMFSALLFSLPDNVPKDNSEKFRTKFPNPSNCSSQYCNFSIILLDCLCEGVLRSKLKGALVFFPLHFTDGGANKVWLSTQQFFLQDSAPTKMTFPNPGRGKSALPSSCFEPGPRISKCRPLVTPMSVQVSKYRITLWIGLISFVFPSNPPKPGWSSMGSDVRVMNVGLKGQLAKSHSFVRGYFGPLCGS